MDVGSTGIHFILVLVLVILGLSGEYSTFSCHFIACQVLIVGSDLVYQTAVGQDLDDTVGSGLYELVVMAGEQCHTGELDQTVVQCSDGPMSRWFVGSSRIRQLAPLIIILDSRQRTFSPPERIRTFFTPSSPANSIRPRKPRT